MNTLQPSSSSRSCLELNKVNGRNEFASLNVFFKDNSEVEQVSDYRATFDFSPEIAGRVDTREATFT